METNNIKMTVESKDGRSLRTYSHEGKTFLESREDVEYQIRLKNKKGDRIKVVVSVDGLNIITGQQVTDEPSETGYILNGYAEEIFRGYRVDENTVASFKFTKKEASYATSSGNAKGNGVIGLRVYAEKVDMNKLLLEKLNSQPPKVERVYVPYPVYPLPYRRPAIRWDYYYGHPYYGDSTWSYTVNSASTVTLNNTVALGQASLRGTTAAACNFTAASAASPNEMARCLQTQEESPFSHGTAWGEAVKEGIKEVEFETGSLLDELTLYYTSAEGLKSLGINVIKEKNVVFPQAFKREWAKPPSGWKA